jgi:hypothetical protein
MRPGFKSITKNQRRMRRFKLWLKSDSVKYFIMVMLVFLSAWLYIRILP